MLRLATSFARTVKISSNVGLSKNFCGSQITAMSALPPNLKLATESVLDEVPEPDFPVINYLFPTLDVPSSITVRKFLEPNAPESELKTMPLQRKIFEVAIRKDIVHDVIRYIRHKKRQPKKTKRLNEISGSKKKPRPQKGTGQSQVGNKRNSVWRGGQKAFGPVLRDYSININRKVRALGSMMTLAAKFREGNLIIFDHLNVPTKKTKDLTILLEQHGLKDKSMMFIEHDDALDPNFALASRNLKNTLVRERRQSNIYEILKKDKLILSSSVFEDIQERLLIQYTCSPKRRTLLRAQKILDDAKAEVLAKESKQE